ncbi:MAG: SCO family protein [Burkholderiaceae bacterium]
MNRKMAAAFGMGLVCLLPIYGSGMAGFPATERKPALDFRLIGPEDKTYTRESFPADAVLVVYFGYTTCWRACPTTLNTIARALDALGASGKNIYPIFISLDAQRDTAEMVQSYANSFSARFTGLTGAREEVLQAASSFDIPVQRVRYSEDDTDYAMKHGSPILVWMPREAEPIRLPASTTSSELETAMTRS